MWEMAESMNVSMGSESSEFEPSAVTMACTASSRSRDVSEEKSKVTLLFWKREVSYPPIVKLASPPLLTTPTLVSTIVLYAYGNWLTLRLIVRPCSIGPREARNLATVFQILHQ